MRRRSGGINGCPSSGGSPDACARRCRSVEPAGPAGSSRSTVPPPKATSGVKPVRSFVTDAHGTGTSVAPCVASTAPTTPAAAKGTSHSSIPRSACTRRDTRSMTRKLVPADSPQAATVGYSRAVRDGRHVHVAGTAPIGTDSTDPYEQAKRCLEIIAGALEEVGAKPEHVVRTRAYLIEPSDWEPVGRAHGEVFADIRPASAVVVVAALLDPACRVEIEAEAVLPE